MSKLFKLILLLVLVGLSIILSSAIVALTFIFEKRKIALKQFKRDENIKAFKKKKLEAEEKNFKLKQSSSSSLHTQSTSTSSSTTSSSSSSTSQNSKQNKIQKDGINPLHPHEIKLRQIHGVTPDSSSMVTIADSHLGLALRDIPFEVHDTIGGSLAFFGVGGSGGGGGDASTSASSSSTGGSSGDASNHKNNSGETSTATSTSTSFSSRYGGNAIPPELKYGAVVPNEDLNYVDRHGTGTVIDTTTLTKNNNNDNDKDQQQNGDESDIEMDDVDEEINIPAVVGGIKRRGVEFVKLENTVHANDGLAKSSSFSSKAKNVKNSIISSLFTSSSSSKRNKNRRKRSSSTTTTTTTTSTTTSTSAAEMNTSNKYAKEQHALFHLQKASEYGNHYAQNMIANSLASGILPINNSPSIRQHLNITLNIASDFAGASSDESNISKSNSMNGSGSGSGSGNKDNDNNKQMDEHHQLTNAILLWHMSAMEGNIESLLALGYRHHMSATSRKVMVHDTDLKTMEALHHPDTRGSSSKNQIRTNKKNTQIRHSPQESDHYGVLGTCESSLVYYEEAMNHIMDELESGPLRGKVVPAQDVHILPEIRQRGSSSALTSNNKPDELDEALKFMEMRALRKIDPDLHSAYKLATMHHYGLNGVKQDMKLALKYYEIGAAGNSWECAGQAGKFYLFGMGLEDEERDLRKAYSYFNLGMPGGISSCEEKNIAKQMNHKGKTDDDDNDDYEGDNDDFEDDLSAWMNKKVYQCDHPSVNGMGLLYLFGVPNAIKPNLKMAVRHFELSTKMGNMDAMYNLAMMRLGWMNPYYDDLFRPRTNGNLDKRNGPSAQSYFEATALLTKSAQMGHMQANHRLGMIYSKGYRIGGGDITNIKPECKKALKIFRDMTTVMGTTVTKRMRAAYKQYMAGDYESSVRNYLAAAETGSISAQVNAAFLLEEGHCLGMSHLQCMKASVRLWRAAARMGHEEACIRVGDFYFYGRLREDIDFDDKNSIVAQRDIEFGLSPLPWIRYILYPEDVIPKVRKGAISFIRWLLEDRKSKNTGVCTAEEGGEAGTCVNPDAPAAEKHEIFSNEQKEHFKIAAKYYRRASKELLSARANFNLGFMHEWGLGLSQDFPLAKRYYDMASEEDESGGDGVLANQIALVFMNIHEFAVKLRSNLDAWLAEQGKEPQVKSSTDPSMLDDNVRTSQPAPSTRMGVIMHHILTWESALILVLTLILTGLIQHRNTRRRPLH